MKKISTTAISKKLGISSKELFRILLDQGLIEKTDDKWRLTVQGASAGGELKQSKQYGDYIVWPEDLPVKGVAAGAESGKMITSTIVGKHFGLSAIKINYVFSELGWVKKGLKGWLITMQGEALGGIQSEDHKSGVPFARWPDSILQVNALIESIEQVKGSASAKPESKLKTGEEVGFREKFEAKHRTTDGHFVRSKAEMLIDNWLYMAEIVHAYERKLPIEEDVYSDFYIPTGKVYIEYWGYENEPKYLARKKKKIEIYKKYGFNLIELQDKEVQNLDDFLPRLLLKFGVQAY